MKIFIQDPSTRISSASTVEAEPTDTIKDVETKIENIFQSVYRVKDIHEAGVDPMKGTLLMARIQDPRNQETMLNAQFKLFTSDRYIAVDDPSSQPGKYSISKIHISLSDIIEDIYLKIEGTLGTGFRAARIEDEENMKRGFAGDWSLSQVYKKSPFDQTLLTRKGILIFFAPGIAKPIPLEVDRNENVGKLKALIREKGISTNDPIILYCHYRELEDNRSLLYYHIQDDWTLRLTRRPRARGSMQILIVFYPGLISPVEVEPHTTIRGLKEEIENYEGFLVRSQKLIFNKTIVLENCRTIQDYDIKKNSIIICVYEHHGRILM
jgi:hypothetical protein